MTSRKIRIKATLKSATVRTFLWWGNSDPIDADETFEDSIDSLYQGALALFPHKQLNSDSKFLTSLTWIFEYSELNSEEKLNILRSTKPCNKIIEIESGELEHVLEDTDYDGFEGDFFYHLKTTIDLEIDEIEGAFENLLRDSLYRNFCFVEKIRLNSKFETASDDGEIIEIDNESYLLVPLSQIEINVD